MAMGKTRSAPTGADLTRLDIVDCASLFNFTELARSYLAISRAGGSEEPVNAPNFDYRAAFEILAKERERLHFSPAQQTLAVATIDPESDGQNRFVTALQRMNILVEAVDFRHATVTMPLGGDGDQSGRKYVTSVGANIAYVLGLLAQRGSPEVVIVTRCFELFDPLRDFVSERRGGKAAIAFFRRFLDPRFGIAGLFDADSPIKFVDL